jgi:hypothetical protein
MKIRPFLTALLLAVQTAAAGGGASTTTPAAAGEKEATLPKGVMGFHGSVSGTVESVDTTGVTLKVKVTKAEADASKSKAPNPESLIGMTIIVTPLEVRDKEGKTVLDEKASAYIKGTKSGDQVTLAVRTSGKGVVFRLRRVPSAGGK